MKFLRTSLVTTLALTSLAAFATEKKDWTLLVYVNGNNNLDPYGADDINEMEQVGSSANVNVVAEYASESARKTTRYLVQKDSNTNTITSPVVEQTGVVDMGDYKTLTEFVKWGAEKYPANHYFVVIWNHGNGWRKKGAISTFGVSYDELSGNNITTPQLGTAMDDAAKAIGQKIDILGFDACLMAMAEVGDEISSSVNYLVGSEETEPGDGWPYDRVLSSWNAKNVSSAHDVASVVVDEYVNDYISNGTSDVTQSAFNLAATEELNASIAELGKNISALSVSDRAALKSSLDDATRFYNSDYADLGSMLSKMETSNVMINKAAISQVRTAISNYVVRSAHTDDLEGIAGVSIWMPSYSYQYSSYASKYDLLKFKSTGWGETLKSFFN